MSARTALARQLAGGLVTLVVLLIAGVANGLIPARWLQSADRFAARLHQPLDQARDVKFPAPVVLGVGTAVVLDCAGLGIYGTADGDDFSAVQVLLAKEQFAVLATWEQEQRVRRLPCGSSGVVLEVGVQALRVDFDESGVWWLPRSTLLLAWQDESETLHS